MDRMIYEVVHKPTFSNQLLALPAKAIPQVLEKIELLRVAPAPDAKNKKRLTGYKGQIFRLRFGDYRIVYTFDTRKGLVVLLKVDTRKDVYRNGDLVADDLSPALEDIPDEDDVLRPNTGASRVTPRWGGEGNTPPAVAPESPRLPSSIEDSLLRRLRIAEEWHDALLACHTVDDLIQAPVPEQVRDRVFDALTNPNIDDVLAEQTLVTGSVDDFRRFYEGSLTHFLLQLDPEQQRFVDWARDGSGPTLVKGGPGTGKSIIALYRVRSLIASLRAAGVARPRILVTSYTNTLVTASRQLLAELLGADRELVTVTTVDKLVWDLLADADALPRKLLSDAGQARGPIVQARDRLRRGSPEDQRAAEALATFSLDFLLEEIDGVIVAREHRDLEHYLTENRVGRGVRLTTTQRHAIWRLHEEREAITGSTGAMTFSQQRRLALELVRERDSPPPFDGVVVDEAQDLEPTAIRLLVALCRSTDRLFLTADPNQAIYGSAFRWADVHEDLQFRGRTGVLRKNYRSTRQIMAAAERFLAEAKLDSSDGPMNCPREGALPRYQVVASRDEASHAIIAFIRDTTRELRIGLGGCAVLVPTRQAGFEMARVLSECGLMAKYMERQEIALDLPAVKVMTRHSAKGLEFPIVAVTGLPIAQRLAPDATDEQVADVQQIERRLLYVAMTRAMDRLLVVISGDDPLLNPAAFDVEWWDIEAGANHDPV